MRNEEVFAQAGFLIPHFSFLISHFSFLISHFSFLVLVTAAPWAAIYRDPTFPIPHS